MTLEEGRYLLEEFDAEAQPVTDRGYIAPSVHQKIRDRLANAIQVLVLEGEASDAPPAKASGF